MLLPARRHRADDRLPVLLDPYGGPHAQRVVAAADAFLTSQWFADQGFAVVVADGRGTPGRGSEWERAVYRDLAGPVLDDQIEALHAAAIEHPQLDLDRVAIRGWSFGGYLAALAVLRRPDVFHAAIAGAPVTEWRLYDTHYTERYLGDPDLDPSPTTARRCCATPHRLERPLLLIHGLADDNVVAAHTLQLSSALLAAGRPHQVLPLSGVTHMTPQEVVAENLLLLQLAFLRQALASRHLSALARAAMRGFEPSRIGAKSRQRSAGDAGCGRGRRGLGGPRVDEAGGAGQGRRPPRPGAAPISQTSAAARAPASRAPRR